jgi:hypothetical protein
MEKDQANQTVRCKFLCNSVTKTQNWSRGDGAPKFVYGYEFSAVYEGSEENKKYFASTPSGNLKINAFKDDLFEPGKEYYLDIQPA